MGTIEDFKVPPVGAGDFHSCFLNESKYNPHRVSNRPKKKEGGTSKKREDRDPPGKMLLHFPRVPSVSPNLCGWKFPQGEELKEVFTFFPVPQGESAEI